MVADLPGQLRAEAAPDAPLTGIRVIDCSRALAGPHAAMTLGDLGADVIKVERPGGGDDARGWLPIVDGESCYFMSANANKRSLVLDLADLASRPVMRRLVETADVLIENFRPGGFAELGYPAKMLAEWNDRLVHCSITAYGSDGSFQKRPGMDVLLQASEGLMAMTGEADRPPVRVGVAIADLIASASAVQGILAALLARDRIGRGQRVEITLQDGLLSWMGYHVTSYLMTGQPSSRTGAAHPALAPYGAYETAEGWLVLAIGTDGLWRDLVAALEAPELGSDARFVDNPSRCANRTALDRLLGDRLIERRAADWAVYLQGAGVPCSPVRSLAETLEDPSISARGLLETVAREDGTTVPFVASPLHLSTTPVVARRAPPRYGEHTAEILAELAIPGT